MLTLSKLHNTNAMNKANTMAHLFLFVPSLMSNLSDSGIPEVSSAIEPPPALAMTFCLLLLLLLDAFVVVVVAATEASFSRFK